MTDARKIYLTSGFVGMTSHVKFCMEIDHKHFYLLTVTDMATVRNLDRLNVTGLCSKFIGTKMDL
jgi:hypothetical protein